MSSSVTICERLTPRLLDESPLAVAEMRPLFRGNANANANANANGGVWQRNCASLLRLDSGRLLLGFRQGAGPDRRNNGVVMLAISDDDGQTWTDPRPLYGVPGWDCLMMGGFALLPGGEIRLTVGRLQVDVSLGGPEPADGWHVSATTSRDGGESWSELGPEIRLFPRWTELYGTSNPHPVGGGRLLWGCQGTLDRDAGWQAGVVFTGPSGDDFSEPVIIAAAPDRDYGDLDIVRLADGRLLAVIREFVVKDAVLAHSADDGQTWTPIRPTGFKAANIKLHRLRSGAILCLYRDEDPARPGVSASVSRDGGETWRFIGQLYAAGADRSDAPGLPCGYPDLVTLDDRLLLGVLHAYPDAQGRVDLIQVRLVDHS